jgi:hypothetical protein
MRRSRRMQWIGRVVAGLAVVTGTWCLFGLTPDAPAQAPAGKAVVVGPEAPDYGLPQVRTINKHIRDGWVAFGMRPSKAAADGEWARRVYLDIIGRIPSVSELEAFLNDRSPDAKARLVDRLLSDDYAEEYTRNWTVLWTNILIGRNGGNEENTMISRDGMQKFLRDGLFRNKPYDRMVHELISATGDTQPGSPSFNGAANFLAGKLDEDGSQATAHTAQIFLGLQIQCTQCHNHPFNDWKQNRYWELNAFFRQTRALRTFVPGTRDIQAVRLANEDFGGDGGDPAEAEIYYELRNGLLKVAYPVFVDGTEIPKSGWLEDVNRREELAKLVVGSEWMSKAIVNRYWSHFLGYGFTKPVDDMGPHNPPSHPELLDELAAEFVKHSHDLKQLIRWIVLSEPYSLSSMRTAANQKDDPLLGEKPKFTHFYLRQMRAEELYASLITATQAQRTRASYEEQEAEMRRWLDQFTIAFGTDEGDETTTFNGTIPQALMMMNGEMIHRATSAEQGSLLWTVARDNRLGNPQKINYLYMAALARRPTAAEVGIANQLFTARGDTVGALQDLWWAILNSNEFIFNH